MVNLNQCITFQICSVVNKWILNFYATLRSNLKIYLSDNSWSTRYWTRKNKILYRFNSNWKFQFPKYKHEIIWLFTMILKNIYIICTYAKICPNPSNMPLYAKFNLIYGINWFGIAHISNPCISAYTRYEHANA
jgi:hypothetical protein